MSLSNNPACYCIISYNNNNISPGGLYSRTSLTSSSIVVPITKIIHINSDIFKFVSSYDLYQMPGMFGCHSSHSDIQQDGSYQRWPMGKSC